MELPKPVPWPAQPSKPEVDTRMVQCVLAGYLECAAKTPRACICNQMDRKQYLDALDRKYGRVT